LHLATDGAGVWVAAWNLSWPGDWIAVSRSTDEGRTWSDPVQLNSDAPPYSGFHNYAKLAADGAGNWMAVWRYAQDGEDDRVLFPRSTDGGQTWTDAAPLYAAAYTDSGVDRNPTIRTDGFGNFLVFWDSGDDLGGTIGTDQDILLSRSTDGGLTWTEPSVVNSNADVDSGFDWGPQATTDGLRNWVVVWSSGDSLNGTVGADQDILFSRSTDGGWTWTPPAPLNTNAAVDSGKDFSPQVATDGLGNWVAAWGSEDSLGGTIGTDADILFAQAVSRDQDDLIVAFGQPGLWVWQNDALWSKLHGKDPDAAVAGDLDGNGQDDLAVDFGDAGLWIWQNDAQWQKLHGTNPDGAVTGDLDGNGQDELVIDFGPPGLWVWENNASWRKLHGVNPECLATGNLDGLTAGPAPAAPAPAAPPPAGSPSSEFSGTAAASSDGEATERTAAAAPTAAYGAG